MAELKWTTEAERRFREIYNYISEDAPPAAQRVIKGIYERVQVLLAFPEIGHQYRIGDRNIRVLLYGHYRIPYLLRSDGDIDILGVFHGAMDWERYLLTTASDPP